MNINFTVQCDTCGEKTNVRFGMSNREVQPVRFACQTCGSPIDIVADKELRILGARRVEGSQPFDADTSFVDLHLDFPVSFEPYEMGMTPFMRASMRVGFEEMQTHALRMGLLDEEAYRRRDFRNILKLYSSGKTKPFKLNIERVFGIAVESDKPQDINAAIYLLIARMMAPYELPEQNSLAVDQFQNVTFDLTTDKGPALRSFIKEVIGNGFLKSLQMDVLEIYPRMLNAELVIRPALFLDFDAEYAANPLPMRVSADEFETYKDLYKDMSEIISRQLVLVAGLNNLLKRGDYNAFAPVETKQGKNIAPANLDKFADIPFGNKPQFLDDPWYEFEDGSLDNKLRNAIRPLQD